MVQQRTSVQLESSAVFSKTFSNAYTVLVLSTLAGMLLVVGLWAIGIGAVPISLKDVVSILGNKLGLIESHYSEQQAVILTVIRLPRVILGMLVGAVLGIAGASMQGIFRNPLADPGLMGISSGASLFAVASIVLELQFALPFDPSYSLYRLSAMAFVGACLSTFIVYHLSKIDGKPQISTMLLTGIALNALAGAITGLLTYAATDAQLRSIQFWSLGSVGGATWQNLQLAFPLLLLPVVGLSIQGKALNAFVLGEDQAEHLGINTTVLKKRIVVLSTLGVGVSVALCGSIGFIGLLIPHLTRLVVGANHRLVLPASALGGSIILTLADLLARTLVAPTELPLGIITALLGTPVFIWMLLQNRTR